MLNRSLYEERMEKFGIRIMKLRAYRGLTVGSLSSFMGIDVSSLKSYEAGGNMTLVTLLALADALEVTPGVMLDGGEVEFTKTERLDGEEVTITKKVTL